MRVRRVEGMIRPFHFWCQKVLPLVYDDSISYLEVLCRVKAKLNEIVESQNNLVEDMAGLKEALEKIDEWIDNFNTTFIKEEIENYIATMIFVEINNDGYIVYNIPETWKDIMFNTTQLDTLVGSDYEYGRLVLSY